MRIPGLTANRLRGVVRRMAARDGTRRVLNRFYGACSRERQEWLHARFAKIFRDYAGPFAPGDWRVDFAGRIVHVPLSGDTAWLDWDLALSVLGHEPEIKQTYETLLGLSPRVVLDVGANYGTHSILFLVHGVRTISFEPNPHCHRSIAALAQANGVSATIEPVAVGAADGTLDLWFPEREEWLGTTDPSTRDRLPAGTPLSTLRVPVVTIDRYVATHDVVPDLIKIDTEGGDVEVLRGAAGTIADTRPIVLFECWPAHRAGAAAVLDAANYAIAALPLTAAPPRVLPSSEFAETPLANFAALPRERIARWPATWHSRTSTTDAAVQDAVSGKAEVAD